MESRFDLGVSQKCHDKNEDCCVAGKVQNYLKDNLKHRKSWCSFLIRNIPEYDNPTSSLQIKLEINEYRQEQLEKWKIEEREKETPAKKKNNTKKQKRKVVPSSSDGVTRSQISNTSIPKTKTVITESQNLSFAPINADFHPPQAINLADALVLPWTKKKKSKSNVEEVKLEPVTKNTKKSTQNKFDTNYTEKDKPENGFLRKTRSGRCVKTPETYIDYIYKSELEKTKKKQQKTVSKKTIPKKSNNRRVTKLCSEEKPQSPKSPQSQLAAETFSIESPNRSSQRMPDNESPVIKNLSREEKLLSNSVKSPITLEQIKELCQHCPFVIRSRGKNNARKEMMKKIKEGLLLAEDASNMKRVQYFEQRLNLEIQRMTELCDSWEKTEKQNVFPATVQELMLSAVGQARLLMSSKLQQFASLVAQCKRPESGAKLVTPADVHGFWDLVYMQIEDINGRFSRLEELRSRGWVEELPRPSAAAPAAPSTPASARGAGFRSARFPGSSSRLLDPQRRASCAMLRVSQMSRGDKLLHNLKLEGIKPLQQTPIQITPVSQSAQLGRSILKSSSQRSTSRSVKKVVVFDESIYKRDESRDIDKEDTAKDKETTANTVEATAADSGPSSTDIKGEGKENKSKKLSQVEEIRTIMTRSMRRKLNAAKSQCDAAPVVTPKSSARKKPLQEARELDSEAQAPRRSRRRKRQ